MYGSLDLAARSVQSVGAHKAARDCETSAERLSYRVLASAALAVRNKRRGLNVADILRRPVRKLDSIDRSWTSG